MPHAFSPYLNPPEPSLSTQWAGNLAPPPARYDHPPAADKLFAIQLPSPKSEADYTYTRNGTTIRSNLGFHHMQVQFRPSGTVVNFSVPLAFDIHPVAMRYAREKGRVELWFGRLDKGPFEVDEGVVVRREGTGMVVNVGNALGEKMFVVQHFGREPQVEVWEGRSCYQMQVMFLPSGSARNFLLGTEYETVPRKGEERFFGERFEVNFELKREG